MRVSNVIYRGCHHLDGWISISISQHGLSHASECLQETRVSTVFRIRQRNQSDSTKKQQHECLNWKRGTHDSSEETIASGENSVIDVVSFRGIFQAVKILYNFNKKCSVKNKLTNKNYFSYGAKVLTLLLELPI